MSSLFLQAIECRNQERRPPVWLMRQAGRYMEEYRELRSKHALSELFHTPELAATITLQPIKRFGMDAAIVFSDILLVLELFGFNVEFPEGKGPFVKGPLDLESTTLRFGREKLGYLREIIELVKPQLTVPLIGFCGGPYTIATYLIGKDLISYWMQEKKEALHILLEKITEAIRIFLRVQEDAGVLALQIFDSWAGLLSKRDFTIWALPYLAKTVQTVRLPCTVFTRNAHEFVAELVSLRPAAMSFDEGGDMVSLRRRVPPDIAIQGNLSPVALLGTKKSVKENTLALLNAMKGEKGFIVNLGHGVLPNTPSENVKVFVDTVKHYTS